MGNVYRPNVDYTLATQVVGDNGRVAFIPTVSSGGSGATADQVQGNIAHDAVDSGNPVKVGGYASGTAPAAVAAGDRVNGWYSLRGAALTVITDAGGSLTSSMYQGIADGYNGANPGVVTASFGLLFNGATWDRQRGDTNGAYVVSKGSGTINTNQVSVGTTATLIVAARAARGSVKITNITGTQQIFIGNTGVTAASGDLIPATVGATITIPANVAIYGIALTSAQTVSFMEVF